MRYGDLIQFEPIESVIQLLDANRPDEARSNRSLPLCCCRDSRERGERQT
ncbi:DUF6079 family protein, partial [Candidatus Accumulibacter aalborgensis]